MVKLPNVNMLVEMADMREANRSMTPTAGYQRNARSRFVDDRPSEEPIMINAINSLSSLSITRDLSGVDLGKSQASSSAQRH